jgi:hypothetical protein
MPLRSPSKAQHIQYKMLYLLSVCLSGCLSVSLPTCRLTTCLSNTSSGSSSSSSGSRKKGMVCVQQPTVVHREEEAQVVPETDTPVQK